MVLNTDQIIYNKNNTERIMDQFEPISFEDITLISRSNAAIGESDADDNIDKMSELSEQAHHIRHFGLC
ncbi:MAG: hypothetical protein ACI8WB_005745 [Phenylobacterium sp.]|jgi:hypothetical protein